jgi:hypothetical protein
MDPEQDLNQNFRPSKKAPGAPSAPSLQGAEGVRSKTSTRMFYEAQVEVIKKQLGSLEKIRHDLGLSQRKMGQLLMVDPSAWTRWNRQDEEAPPHIWRSLQWYMALNEKLPGLTPQYFIGKDPQILHEKALQRIDAEKSLRESLELDLVVLKRSQKDIQDKLIREAHFHRRLSYFFAGLTLALAGFILSRL